MTARSPYHIPPEMDVFPGEYDEPPCSLYPDSYMETEYTDEGVKTYLDLDKRFASKTIPEPCIDDLDMSSWKQKHPQNWSTREVLDWVHFVAQNCEMIQGHIFRGENFNTLSGRHLCVMSEDEFKQRDPNYGEILFKLFQKLSADSKYLQPAFIDLPYSDQPLPSTGCASYPMSHVTEMRNCDILDISSSTRNLPSQRHARIGLPPERTANIDIDGHSYDFDSSDLFPDLSQAPGVIQEDEGYDSGDSEKENVFGSQQYMPSPDFHADRPVPYPGMMPQMQHSASLYPAPRIKADPYLHPSSSDCLSACLKCRPSKRLPGRPRKNRISSDGSSESDYQPQVNHRGRKPGQAAKGNHLWEFIRDMLKNPTYNPKLIRWEDRKEGVFRFVQSEAVAQMWGRKKNNPGMTYEKLSRAMRFCRTAGYFTEVPKNGKYPKKLCFKFGDRAFGWLED